MKPTAIFLLMSTVIQPVAVCSEPLFKVPQKITCILDSKYPGWHLINNLSRIPSLYSSGVDTTKCRPNFVWGDFDGNGELDYVVFIERKVGEAPREQFLVAFLAHGPEFIHHLLDEAKGDGYITEFIWLAEKGSKSYNFVMDEEFVLEHDSIELIVYYKSSSLIYYDKGEFVRVTTGD